MELPTCFRQVEKNEYCGKISIRHPALPSSQSVSLPTAETEKEFTAPELVPNPSEALNEGECFRGEVSECTAEGFDITCLVKTAACLLGTGLAMPSDQDIMVNVFWHGSDETSRRRLCAVQDAAALLNKLVAHRDVQLIDGKPRSTFHLDHVTPTTKKSSSQHHFSTIGSIPPAATTISTCSSAARCSH